MYSSTLSLTWALDGVGGQRHAPADLPPGETRHPLCRRLGGPRVSLDVPFVVRTETLSIMLVNISI
jgi:hypothetical protein